MSTRRKETRASETETTSAVVERLSWQTAQRDDMRVAKALHGEQEIDAMHELSEAGLLDEFYSGSIKRDSERGCCKIQ